MATFTPREFTLPKPPFESSLTSTIIDLEKLRTKELGGDVHPAVFVQLKVIFQLLESLGSARIEGNNTTLSDLVERQIDGASTLDEQMKEIANMESAMNFIDEHIKIGEPITKEMIRQFHTLVVRNLMREGDRTPGRFRTTQVHISNSQHLPPPGGDVDVYVDELVSKINEQVEKKYDLLLTATAHHRFTWVHPYGNGNGRVVRLLTYAMLIKQGFNVNRIINPTAVFCTDRNRYYEMLAAADTGTEQGLLDWNEYVLNGLLTEISKIDNLLDHKYLYGKILAPAISDSLANENITRLESEILLLTAKKMRISASDIAELMPGKQASEVSRQIRRLRDKKMLLAVSPATNMPQEHGRAYVLSFSHSYLLRGVMSALKEENFYGVTALAAS